MKFTIGFDKEIAILLNQAPDIVRLGRRKSVIEGKGNWPQPKLHFEVVARNMNVRWLVRFAAVEMEPVWTDPQDGGHSHLLRQGNQGINPRSPSDQKRKGAFVSESALHFDGDKPNSVVRLLPDVMIIYLSSLA